MISPDTARVFRVNGHGIAFHPYQTKVIAEGNSEKILVPTASFGSGHLVTTIGGYERVALIRTDRDAASRDSQCVF